jgi:hypothetical protein
MILFSEALTRFRNRACESFHFERLNEQIGQLIQNQLSDWEMALSEISVQFHLGIPGCKPQDVAGTGEPPDEEAIHGNCASLSRRQSAGHLFVRYCWHRD